MASNNNQEDIPQAQTAQHRFGVISTAAVAAAGYDFQADASLTKVILQSENTPRVMAVIRGAVDKEIARLEKSASYALNRLERFETQYNVPSSEFAERFTAEDLQGGDLEYVEWIGEYQLFQHLLQDLTLLKSLTYVAE
ncbi:MAG: hypothetical protein KME47_16570 [Nodosilinea sp. WJT8-NPBG4]|nr:hypothetical protein [Nodosilinea sp. WJT8-NPBG4]